MPKIIIGIMLITVVIYTIITTEHNKNISTNKVLISKANEIKNITKVETVENRFNEYTQKVLNTKIDFDGYHGNQCVDLSNDFYNYVKGKKPRMINKGARDIFNLNAFVNDPNTITIKDYSQLQKGDIMWYSIGQDGHTAIYAGGGKILSQNHNGSSTYAVGVVELIDENLHNFKSTFIGAYRLK